MVGSMRAVIVREFGPISGHSVGELPNPKPARGQVLVKIRAVAVNYVDGLVVTGKYQFLPARPFAPGKLPVGEISGLGPGVTEFKIGDRVLTLAEHGGHAELVSIDANQCFKLPSSMSFVDAAAMALVYDTAWFALHERARLHGGESVLVLGGTGAVGLAAIQIAKAMQARVLAGVSNPSKASLALKAGCDDIIDLSKENLHDALREQVFKKNAGNGVDIVIDPIGGDAFDAALRALAWQGRLVVIGFASGRIPTVKANYLLVKNITICGLQVSDYRKRRPDLMAQCIQEIFAMFQSGKIKPAPTVTYPLDSFAEALQKVVDRRASGRIVLLPNP
jgi:NADPH:quinone reductase